MKNEGNGNALYKLIEEKNISEKFVPQTVKYVMDLIPDLLENKNNCCAMQTRSQLKKTWNINMDKNKDNIKNKLSRNFEATNKVQKKRGRPRKIIQKLKLQEPIEERDRPRKVINKSSENDKFFWSQMTNPILIKIIMLNKSLKQIRRKSILMKIQT